MEKQGRRKEKRGKKSRRLSLRLSLLRSLARPCYQFVNSLISLSSRGEMRTSLRPRASGTETQRSDRALFGAECRRVPAARRRPAAPGGAIGSKRSGGELTRNPSPLLCSAALALVNPARYLPRFAPCSEQRGLCREVLPRWSSKETPGERLQGSILMGIRFRREIGSAPRRSLQRLSPVDYAPSNPTSFPSPPPPLPPHPRNKTLARRKRKSRRHQ